MKIACSLCVQALMASSLRAVAGNSASARIFSSSSVQVSLEHLVQAVMIVVISCLIWTGFQTPRSMCDLRAASSVILASEGGFAFTLSLHKTTFGGGPTASVVGPGRGEELCFSESVSSFSPKGRSVSCPSRLHVGRPLSSDPSSTCRLGLSSASGDPGIADLCPEGQGLAPLYLVPPFRLRLLSSFAFFFLLAWGC